MNASLRRLALLVAALQLVFFAWVAARRLGYPFDVEWMEGGELTRAVRIAAGRSPYGPPNVEFTSFFYTPLYPAVVAGLSKLSGDVTHALGRGVSIGSTLGTMGLLAWVLRREADAWHAALGVGLYAGLDRFAGTFTSVARPDALALLLAFGAAVLARYGRSARSAAVAGALAVLAVYTKQTMVILGGASALWLLLCDRRRGLVFLGTTTALGCAAWVVLDRMTSGWFSFYVQAGHQSHAFYWHNLVFFFFRDALFLAPLVLLAPLAWLRARHGDWAWTRLATLHLTAAFLQRALTLDYPPHMYFRELWYETPRVLLLAPPALIAWLLLRREPDEAMPSAEPPRLAESYFAWMFVAAMTASAIGHSTQWAYKNTFLPLALFGALSTTLALRELSARRGVMPAWVVSLLLLFDAPSARAPTGEDHLKLAAMNARLAQIGGPILVLAHPLSAWHHDRTLHVHQMALGDVALLGGVAGFEGALASHRFSAVVTDEGDGLPVPAAVRAHYRPVEPIDGPTMKAGLRSHPARLWLPLTTSSTPASAR